MEQAHAGECRIPPRQAARRFPQRRRAGLHQRLGAARRREGARLFRVRAGAASGRAACRGQSRLRAKDRQLSGASRARRRSSAICAGRRRRRWFVADHDASADVWFVRDHRAMARVRGWGEVAPFYIEQEAPVPPGGVPHPARLRSNCATTICNMRSPGSGSRWCWWSFSRSGRSHRRRKAAPNQTAAAA